MEHIAREFSIKNTKLAFLWTQLLGNPFFSILDIFAIILLKELDISGIPFAIVLALKPASSLLSPYWSAIIHRRQDLVKTNLLLANLIRYLPFLFFPFYKNIWLFVLSIGIYWIMTRGMNPAWMEFIKVTIPKGKQEKICAHGLKINYWGNILLPILIGPLLDSRPAIWLWVFPLTAVIGLLSTLFIHYLLPQLDPPLQEKKKNSFREILIRPWRDAFQLVRLDKSFFHFQCVFFFGGAGLMLFHPAMKKILTDLQLSYTMINITSTMVKGIGFIIASPFWVRQFSRLSLLKLSRLVLFCALGFPCIFLFGSTSLLFIFLAFFLYGVMQAGSELIWHMSGPYYSKQKSSPIYSSTNLLTAGLRGAFFPCIGTGLLSFSSSSLVLFFGGIVIFMGTLLATFFIRSQKETIEVESA